MLKLIAYIAVTTLLALGWAHLVSNLPVDAVTKTLFAYFGGAVIGGFTTIHYLNNKV